MQIRKIFLAVFGFVTLIVGWGMWTEPQLDIDILFSLITQETTRLAGDPFAVLGLMIMVFGIWALFKSFLQDDKNYERFIVDRHLDDSK